MSRLGLCDDASDDIAADRLIYYSPMVKSANWNATHQRQFSVPRQKWNTAYLQEVKDTNFCDSRTQQSFRCTVDTGRDKKTCKMSGDTLYGV